MTGVLGSEGQQRVASMLAFAAAVTAARQGPQWVMIQPFSDKAGKRPCLGLSTRQPTLKLGNSGALVEERPPVLDRPIPAHRPQEPDYGRLVLDMSAISSLPYVFCYRRRRPPYLVADELFDCRVAQRALGLEMPYPYP